MRKILFLATLVLSAMAQTPNAQQPTDPPKKARIEGTVVSSAGPAIPRAQVRLQGQAVLNLSGAAPANFSATADDAGKFVIENIEPGRNYQLMAQRPGFVPARYGARSPSAPGALLTIDAGADLKSLVITMTPQGVITGRVTDLNGDPAQGAIVAALRRGYQRGMRQLVAAGTGQVNDQGEFRIANLTPGKYYIVASDRSRLILAAGVAAPAGREGNLTTFYPNATDPQGAVALDVAAGAELRGIDIRFRSGAMYSIRGKVDPAGAAPANVTITAVPRDAALGANIIATLSQSAAQARAPEYSFELSSLTPGSYVVQTRTQNVVNGTSAMRLGNWTEVNVTDANINGLVISLATGPPIKGAVTIEGGDLKALFPANAQNNPATAVAAAAAGVVISGLRPAVGLVSINGLPNAAASAPIEENGTFLLEGVAPGKYQINVASLPQGFFAKSARYGGQDALRNGLDIGTGGGELAIVLSNKGGQISGSVMRQDLAQEAQTLAGFLVSLWTKNPEPGSMNNGVRTTYTDQNGAFQFRNLPPGEYFAAAWEEADAQLVLNRDFLGQFGSEGSSVTIQEGGAGSAQVRLISGEKISAAEAKIP